MSHTSLPVPDSSDPKEWDAWLNAEEKASRIERTIETRKQKPGYEEAYHSNNTNKKGGKYSQKLSHTERSVRPAQELVDFDNKPFAYIDPKSKAERQKRRRNKNDWKKNIQFQKTALMIKQYFKG